MAAREVHARDRVGSSGSSPVTRLWVYALLDAELRAAADGPRGVLREPVRALQVAPGLFAAVGALAVDPPGPSEAALRAHDAAVRALALATPAVLPVRFGQTAEDEAALRARLTARADELTGALALVRGCEQMTLRVFGRPEPPPPPPGEEGLGPGARYLSGRRRAQQGGDVPALGPLLEALAPLVRGARVERPSCGSSAPRSDQVELLASVYHLVRRGHAATYAECVDALAPSLSPRRVTVSGPWPAYAFAPSS